MTEQTMEQYAVNGVNIDPTSDCKNCGLKTGRGMAMCRPCWEIEDGSCYLCRGDLACNHCDELVEPARCSERFNAGWHCTGCDARIVPV